jgi:uncharacterized phiE125 gp8 family phage protein
MQWTVSTPPAATILTFDQLSWHLRLDPDTAAQSDEVDYVTDLLAAATEYAENAMATSLVTRTITATYFPDDHNLMSQYQRIFNAASLILPRGPVTAVTSVTDNGNPITAFEYARIGNTDLLAVPNGWIGPLVVVYTAGYGDETTVPADIRQAIRVHVGSMYKNRESVTAGSMTAVPHSLADFYSRKCRTSVVG